MFDQKLNQIHCFCAASCTLPDRTRAGSRIILPGQTAAPSTAHNSMHEEELSQGGKWVVLQMFRQAGVCTNKSKHKPGIL